MRKRNDFIYIGTSEQNGLEKIVYTVKRVIKVMVQGANAAADGNGKVLP